MSEPRRADTIRLELTDCEVGPVVVRLTRLFAMSACVSLLRFMSDDERKLALQEVDHADA